MEFGVGLTDSIAAQLGLPAGDASLWSIGLALTAQQACMAPRDRDAAARALILSLLSSKATAVADVGIAASSVVLGGVTCGVAGGRRGGGATGAFQTVVVFQVRF